ncbi:trifunctional hydroxymethylpyrimidine kinase/phosphomethylpyrimidine kinase/thiaminase [Collariella sp. IMI 366227]|nr:trifunctional hydroxymethylpyrimidine kinase/phosphomethylpyrimidine kinase/thiaminase [Collariella sp. IMI 366227]
MAPGRVLVIAGSDSSGGAGLEADQKVIAAHGCYAMTATTALTAQNTKGVYGIHLVPPEFLRKQIDAVIEDIGVDVVKTGNDSNNRRPTPPRLNPQPAPHPPPAPRTIVTPNVPEALLLLKEDSTTSSSSFEEFTVKTPDDLVILARAIREKYGSKWVLVKGGHCPFDGRVVVEERGGRERVVDVLVGEGVDGEGAEVVVRMETEYCASPFLLLSVQLADVLRGHFVDYLLERPDVAPIWEKFVNHPFVLAMGDGTLPVESFKGYLIQDYLYLIQFARANALASYKAGSMKDISASATIVTHVFKEMELHIKYCEGFGISREEMENTEEKEGKYVLDIGQSQDWLGLQVSMAPCLLGYGALAKKLHADPRSKQDGNLYWEWIQNYVAADYTTAVKTGSELLERHAVLQSPARIEEGVG